MVNDLQDLMRQNVASPPPDDTDLTALVRAGRRRVRVRRTALAGVSAAVVAGVLVGGAALTGFAPGADTDDLAAANQPPRPNAPVLRLADAAPAVEGTDYRLLTSYTNENLNADNGQYLDGVTDDGLILFRDGPRSDQLYPRYALMDPATGTKDWLPDPGLGQDNVRPIELGADRLVLLSDNGTGRHLSAYVFDRETREWSTTSWPGLPRGAEPDGVASHDGRLYLRVLATAGRIPEGGWPTQEDGDAEDADAEGSSYHLWSVSPTDGSDVRDEQLIVGAVTFTDSSMVWTDSTKGDAGNVHVRDLATGEEHSFDPDAGERCNLLGFGATDERIVLSQYCGTYADGVRDDRVQILTSDGDQVVTLQDSGVDGWLPQDSGQVTITAYRADDEAGTYVYDLGTDRLVRVSDAVSSWGSGTASGDQFFWHTPVNQRRGATQWLGELID